MIMRTQSRGTLRCSHERTATVSLLPSLTKDTEREPHLEENSQLLNNNVMANKRYLDSWVFTAWRDARCPSEKKSLTAGNKGGKRQNGEDKRANEHNAQAHALPSALMAGLKGYMARLLSRSITYKRIFTDKKGGNCCV